MKSTRRRLLSVAGEIALVLGAHFLLWAWLADNDVAARVLAAGAHVPKTEMAAVMVFVLVRFFALVLLPGVVLARLAGLAFDRWGPKPSPAPPAHDTPATP